MKIPSGFDFERGLVVSGAVCSDIKGGVYWNEGDVGSEGVRRRCEFSGETGEGIRVCCDW